VRCFLLVVVALLGLGCERAVLYWMTADAEAPGVPAADQRMASADVFYVHPTSYVGPLWNAPIDDPRLNAATDRVATRIQASAFNACCAVHAPRYRQANGTAFTHPTEDGQRALDVAYADVRAAFHHFLARAGELPSDRVPALLHRHPAERGPEARRVAEPALMRSFR
jgi:hypothetical protein